MNIIIASNVFVGTCSGIVIPGITEEVDANENLVASVRDIFSVVSVLFIFGFREVYSGCLCLKMETRNILLRCLGTNIFDDPRLN